MPTRLRRIDEPGHVHFWAISCHHRLSFFWHDALKQVVVDGLAAMQARFGVCLIGYVIMPDHVHVLVYPHAPGCDEPVAVSQLLHHFKKHVGFHGKRQLRAIWRRDKKLWSEALDAWAADATIKHSIWNKRGYDFNIHRQDALLEKLDYCHKNPITRELVESAERWRWSSYRFYDCGDESLIRMNWDGTWPIAW